MPIQDASQSAQSAGINAASQKPAAARKSIPKKSAPKELPAAKTKKSVQSADKTAGKTTEKKNDAVKVTRDYRIENSLFKFIPYASAELYRIVPLEKRDNVLYVGAVDPGNLDARDALNFITAGQDLKYRVQKLDETIFKTLLEQYGDTDFDMEEALGGLEDAQGVQLGIDDEDVEDIDSESLIREEAPIIKLVSTILAQAVAKEVSDIHIEPGDKSAIVRYRLDGILQDRLQFSRVVHDSFVARIKILANLRIDERRRPQDGRFSSRIRDNRVDFRVSVFPTVDGEKVVLRVLDKQKGLRHLTDLGFEEWIYERVLKAIQKPYGLILATGPTGAGKTTTLYSILSMIDRKNRNIISLEDPVEYRLERVNQSNIRPEIGYTFATGLRSVLRGDPDQIFVGEIRDKETAQLAVQAALTGHLVYSTLHTNSAIGAVSRLINFGVDPFLLAPTLSLVIGQRMVRRLDGEGKELPVSATMRAHLEKQFTSLPQRWKSNLPEFSSFREAVPTDDNASGMRGRVGVFEVLEIDNEVRSVIFESPSEIKIYDAVRKKGFFTMAEDALVKGLRGIIPYSEAMKIGNESILIDAEES